MYSILTRPAHRGPKQRGVDKLGSLNQSVSIFVRHASRGVLVGEDVELSQPYFAASPLVRTLVDICQSASRVMGIKLTLTVVQRTRVLGKDYLVLALAARQNHRRRRKGLGLCLDGRQGRRR
jgi:hypothetical protein